MATEEAGPAGKRRPTLADVAARARVSTSTASRALRDSPLVSEATRKRVRAASQGLGFEPNRLARSLRTRSSMFVGVIVPDVATAFYAAALKAAQSVFEDAGYQVLVMDSERNPAREAANLRTLLAHRVDGILLATSGGLVEAPGVPVVFFDENRAGVGNGSVLLANREGTTLLVEHLAGHGHERIAFVGAPTGLTSARERLEGFEAALAAAGVRFDPAHVALGDTLWSVESGEAAARSLLALPSPPTAIIGASDTLAVGTLRATRELGLRVPEDVALVSFDDPAHGDLLDPPITALSRHDRDLGDRAARMLVHALCDETPAAPTEARVPLQLVVRRSCGCGRRS